MTDDPGFFMVRKNESEIRNLSGLQLQLQFAGDEFRIGGFSYAFLIGEAI